MRNEAAQAGAAVVGLYAALMLLALHAAPKLKRRETWRLFMAALCGLGVSYKQRGQDDDR